MTNIKQSNIKKSGILPVADIETGRKILASIFAGALLLISIMAFIITVYFHEWSMIFQMPSLGNFNAEKLTEFCQSRYPMGFAAVFTGLLLLLLYLVNKDRKRRFFFACGLVLALDAGVCIFLQRTGISLTVSLFPEMRDIFAGTVSIFSDFLAICAVITAMAAGIMFSVCACIWIIRGGQR